jgi:hypothetical protein
MLHHGLSLGNVTAFGPVQHWTVIQGYFTRAEWTKLAALMRTAAQRSVPVGGLSAWSDVLVQVLAQSADRARRDGGISWQSVTKARGSSLAARQ